MGAGPQESFRYPRADWQYEVRNGDTNLGYQEWVEHKIESDMKEIEARNASC